MVSHQRSLWAYYKQRLLEVLPTVTQQPLDSGQDSRPSGSVSAQEVCLMSVGESRAPRKFSCKAVGASV